MNRSGAVPVTNLRDYGGQAKNQKNPSEIKEEFHGVNKSRFNGKRSKER